MRTKPKFAQPSCSTEIAVRRYTSWSWKATGPSSFHHSRKRGCHDSSARSRRRSADRSTLFGIRASTSTVLTGSHPLPVVRRPGTRPEPLQRTLGADGVRALEDPVLPRGQAGEDLALERLRSREAEVRLHPGERVGRESVAFLDGDADLVVPVEVVRSERH